MRKFIHFIKNIFCMHPALKSVEISYGLGSETRITYPSAWSLFGVKETHYLCKKCGRSYWYPRGNQAEKEMNERFYNFLVNSQKE
jgi:hypothetical protein